MGWQLELDGPWSRGPSALEAKRQITFLPLSIELVIISRRADGHARGHREIVVALGGVGLVGPRNRETNIVDAISWAFPVIAAHPFTVGSCQRDQLV